MALKGCAEGLQKPPEIARRTAALRPLRQKLRDPERQATAGFFGAATASAKHPVKAHPPPATPLKRQGAQPGPPGAGRQAFDASPAARVVDIAPIMGHRGPAGDVRLADTGPAGRAVLESCPVQAERVRYRLPQP